VNARFALAFFVACAARRPQAVTIEALPSPAPTSPSLVEMIPNTNVDDTPDNRAVLAVCERYRRAMESRDTDAVLAVTSRRYHDGTVTYENLPALLKRVTANVISVRYDLRYEKISRTVNEVFVDVQSVSSVEMANTQWTHKVDTSRLVLVREDGAYRIIRGM
jgi:hypothetical protein